MPRYAFARTGMTAARSSTKQQFASTVRALAGLLPAGCCRGWDLCSGCCHHSRRGNRDNLLPAAGEEPLWWAMLLGPRRRSCLFNAAGVHDVGHVRLPDHLPLPDDVEREADVRTHVCGSLRVAAAYAAMVLHRAQQHLRCGVHRACVPGSSILRHSHCIRVLGDVRLYGIGDGVARAGK